MRTMAQVVELEPIHGFAAETTAATVILAAAHLGMPVSTPFISSAIMGVGSSKGRRGVHGAWRAAFSSLGRDAPGHRLAGALAWGALATLGIR